MLDDRIDVCNARAMDLLHDHLVRARASGAVFERSVVRAPWGLELADDHQLAIHAVVRGHAWVWLGDPSEAIRLGPGEVALIRGGSPVHLADDPAAACRGIDAFKARHFEDGEADAPGATVFFCGAYQVTGDIGRGLLEALPPILSLAGAVGDPIRTVVELCSGELADAAPGEQTVLDRLLDVLLVLAIRHHFRHAAAGAPAWFRGAADVRVGPALRALHADPARAWTVSELAAVCGLSRAAFARSFTQVIDQTPMAYLADWRMTIARDLLRAGDASLSEIATRVGYATSYAFATAFRRHHGLPPGQWRRRHLPKAASHADAALTGTAA